MKFTWGISGRLDVEYFLVYVWLQLIQPGYIGV